MDLTTVEKNLKERGFKVSAFATAKEAADYLNAQIDGESVSFGGSMTLVDFVRYEKGEGLEKRADDFASEVASMVK